jgi:RHS repeat-associated protein
MTYDSLSKKIAMTDPDMGSWTYDYDKSGNLRFQTDAKGQTVEFQYDGLNRATHKIYHKEPQPYPTVYFTYDDPAVLNSKGKLTKVSYQPPGEELREDAVLEYDLMQRVTRSQKTIPGMTPAVFEKTYDSAGRAIGITYPGSRLFSYRYDVAGNLLTVKDGNEATGITVAQYSNFTALGQPRQANFSNSVSTTYDYYARTTRLHTLSTQKPGNPAYQNLTYQYDPKGNISTLNDQANGIIHTYSYDSLDRLREANGGGAYPTQSYDYDRIGNITYKSDVGTYTYYYGNKPHAVRSTTGLININLQYDANGNMTERVQGGVTTTVAWNYDNKPTSITKGSTAVSFVYDGNGVRVKKNQTVFYFGELYEVRNGVNVLHVFAGNRRVASIRSDGNHQFYHGNHLGSASVITGQDGDWRERIEYYPFGTYLWDEKNPNYPNFPDANYTFTDQEDDDELGLYNYGARLYDPLLGRFISPDRLVPDPGDPQALNRYTYCLNNPLIYTDPSGEMLDWVAYLIAAVLMGAFNGAVQAHMNNQNWFVGAVVGAAIGAASFGAGYGVGFVVTQFLAPIAQTAVSAAAVSATRVAGVMAGGFAGGAVAGGLNAAVYGGNIWQAALYGGLAAAAFAGTVAAAIELNNWANSQAIGGPAESSGGVKPPGEVPPGITLPELKYNDLFFGSETKETSPYYQLRESATGETYPHGGVDKKPVWGANSYGSVGSAPSDITVTYKGSLSGYGPVTEFNVQGYSPNLIIRIGHAQALDGLPGDTIGKGSALFKLRYVPNVTTGPHAHIEVLFGGYKWNPGIVFK